MEEKVVNGQLKSRQGLVAAIGDNGIVKGGTEDFREEDGSRRTFLERLLKRKEEIEKSINILSCGKKEHTGLFSADEIIEELDRAVVEIEAQTHFSLLERKNKELKKIKILIQRARNEEEFGLCENCEGQIPEGRLLIVPEATLCVPCQREMEKWESGRSSTKRSYRAFHGKREFEWTDDDSAHENEEFVFRSAPEFVSFEDLEETDLEDNPKESDKK